MHYWNCILHGKYPVQFTEDNGKYSCTECDYSHVNQEEVINHILIHHPPENYWNDFEKGWRAFEPEVYPRNYHTEFKGG